MDKLTVNHVFEIEQPPLEKFYQTMIEKIRSIDNLAGKQEIMRTLYDKFFAKAFSAMQDRLGIVFTPVPVVNYILCSANDALRMHFGKSLGDEGVAIIDPACGSGSLLLRFVKILTCLMWSRL